MVYRELTDPTFLVAGAREVQTFEWVQTCSVGDRTIVEVLSNELDLGEAEAIAKIGKCRNLVAWVSLRMELTNVVKTLDMDRPL